MMIFLIGLTTDTEGQVIKRLITPEGDTIFVADRLHIQEHNRLIDSVDYFKEESKRYSKLLDISKRNIRMLNGTIQTRDTAIANLERRISSHTQIKESYQRELKGLELHNKTLNDALNQQQKSVRKTRTWTIIIGVTAAIVVPTISIISSHAVK